jgi:hypothetical protein
MNFGGSVEAKLGLPSYLVEPPFIHEQDFHSSSFRILFREQELAINEGVVFRLAFHRMASPLVLQLELMFADYPSEAAMRGEPAPARLDYVSVASHVLNLSGLLRGGHLSQYVPVVFAPLHVCFVSTVVHAAVVDMRFRPPRRVSLEPLGGREQQISLEDYMFPAVHEGYPVVYTQARLGIAGDLIYRRCLGALIRAAASLALVLRTNTRALAASFSRDQQAALWLAPPVCVPLVCVHPRHLEILSPASADPNPVIFLDPASPDSSSSSAPAKQGSAGDSNASGGDAAAVQSLLFDAVPGSGVWCVCRTAMTSL